MKHADEFSIDQTLVFLTSGLSESDWDGWQDLEQLGHPEQMAKRLQVIWISQKKTALDPKGLQLLQVRFGDFKFVDGTKWNLQEAATIGARLAAGREIVFLQDLDRPVIGDLLDSSFLQLPRVSLQNWRRGAFCFGAEDSGRLKIEDVLTAKAKASQSAAPKSAKVEVGLLAFEGVVRSLRDPLYVVTATVLRQIWTVIQFIFYRVLIPVVWKIYFVSLYHYRTYIVGPRENWILLYRRIFRKSI